jgi:hypothetical protein
MTAFTSTVSVSSSGITQNTALSSDSATSTPRDGDNSVPCYDDDIWTRFKGFKPNPTSNFNVEFSHAGRGKCAISIALRYSMPIFKLITVMTLVISTNGKSCVACAASILFRRPFLPVWRYSIPRLLIVLVLIPFSGSRRNLGEYI